MGRASRRKRANGGPGFFRQTHLLAAAGRQEAAPLTVGSAALPQDVPDRGQERLQSVPADAAVAEQQDLSADAVVAKHGHSPEA